jgi:hypothetical protein
VSKARAALRDGNIPARAPDRTWAWAGQIQFARDGSDPGLDKFHVHIRCFAAWEFERTSAPPSLERQYVRQDPRGRAVVGVTAHAACTPGTAKPRRAS